MDNFARLCNTSKFGQILLVIDSSDDGKPQLAISFKPPELGVCTVKHSFKDDDDGWDAAEKSFLKLCDESELIKRITPVFAQMGVFGLDDGKAEEGE